MLPLGHIIQNNNISCCIYAEDTHNYHYYSPVDLKKKFPKLSPAKADKAQTTVFDANKGI